MSYKRKVVAFNEKGARIYTNPDLETMDYIINNYIKWVEDPDLSNVLRLSPCDWKLNENNEIVPNESGEVLERPSISEVELKRCEPIEVIKEVIVEKVVLVPQEVIKEVEKIVYVDKVVEIEKLVEVIKEVQVDRIVEVPVEVIKIEQVIKREVPALAYLAIAILSTIVIILAAV